jgi:hypothetical protein
VVATAALWRDGSDDPRPLVATVTVGEDRITRDEALPGAWRCFAPISTDEILHLAMSDESELLVDEESVNAMAEQMRQEEPDWRAAEETA